MKLWLITALIFLITYSPAQLTWESCPDLSNSDFQYESLLTRAENQALEEPMRLKIDAAGRLFVSMLRTGKILMFDPSENHSMTEIAHLDVTGNTFHGILGIVLAPDFMESGHMYTLTNHGNSPILMRLSRYTLVGTQLDISSQKILLEWDTDIPEAHTGGDMAFDGQGNLFISTGSDAWAHPYQILSPDKPSYPRGDNGYAYHTPIDERLASFNALRSSANTNDLRGKMLRIKPVIVPDSHPKEDWGMNITYTIPEGNMYPVGTEKTRPEILHLGMRNPYGIHVEPNGTVFIGEVGPQGYTENFSGPPGGDQLYIASQPTNFGHPMFVHGNQPYAIFDFEADQVIGEFDPDLPVNYSIFNTGLDTLPPVKVATAFNYEAGNLNTANDWFEGGPLAMFGGPVYWYNGNNPSTVKFPPHFNGKWLFFDAMQGTIKAATLDGEEIIDIVRFANDIPLRNPTDIEFGADGSLYIVEYSYQGLFNSTSTSGVSRITYTGECHPDTPIAVKKQKPAFDQLENTRRIMLGSSHHVPVKKGASRVDIYTLQGQLVFTAPLKSGQREVYIPRHPVNGVGLVKFDIIPH